MDKIKIPKAEVICWRRGQKARGTLHLSQNHIIFRYVKSKTQNTYGETWIAYPMISFCSYRQSPPDSPHPPAIRLRCRDFNFMAFHFDKDSEARAVFENIKLLTCKVRDLNKLYAFTYESTPREKQFNGWTLYDPRKEFSRMGISADGPGQTWRISSINTAYQYCETYPAYLCVPTSISDTTLRHTASFRSKARIPVLTYKYSLNNCTITRSAQPNVGVRLSRSPQDERLVAAIFSTTKPSRYSLTAALIPSNSTTELEIDDKTSPLPAANSSLRSDIGADTAALDNNIANIDVSQPQSQSSSEGIVSSGDSMDKVYGAQQTNMIIDARPSVNAMANHAKGYGSERMEGYKGAQKIFLGIENIHVMRAALNIVIDAVKDSDLTNFPPDRSLLEKSKWRRHITLVLEGTRVIAQTIAIKHSHVLIHCSDGWDRTSQLSALSQICLDPYYRTIDGFITLVEKDWLSFGHMFRMRTGPLSSEKWFEVENERTTGYRNATIDENVMESDGANPFEVAISRAQMFFRRRNEIDDEDVGDNNTNSVENSPSSNRKSINSDMDTKISETSPIFHQFLDAVYQLQRQFPTRFEYNERFLKRLLYHLYSCQYGTFLYNNEKERKDSKASERTRSVWEYFLSRKPEFTNPVYDSEVNENLKEKASLLLPDAQDVRWWFELFGRTDEEMNGPAVNSPGDVIDGSQSFNAEKDEEVVTGFERRNLLPLVTERLRPVDRKSEERNIEEEI